jgi:hypothetical protein
LGDTIKTDTLLHNFNRTELARFNVPQLSLRQKNSLYPALPVQDIFSFS